MSLRVPLSLSFNLCKLLSPCVVALSVLFITCEFRVLVSVSLSKCFSCFVFQVFSELLVLSVCIYFLSISVMYFGFTGFDLMHRVLTDADFWICPFLGLLCMTSFWTLL